MGKRSKVTKPFPVSNLKYLHDAHKLWLNPEYQRESVWTRSQQQLLVDSLFREIDVPKLYFREIEKEGYEYEAVDGQQRLRAVFDFMSDGFKMPLDSDDVSGLPVAGMRFSGLATDLQMMFQNVPLDVVVMNSEYTDDDIEEIFLRLQNGTPLNAAEKRRAVAGTMRKVVEELARHKVFGLCAFQDKRYAFEDATAKLMHLLLAGVITDIRPTSIKRTYETHASITTDHREAKRLKQALAFLAGAFKGKQSPRLKKYAIVTLGYLVVEMLDEYDLSKHSSDFAEAYLEFETRRIANEELPEDEQDSALAAYTDAARADSIPDLRYRHDFLKSYFLDSIPTLVLKDPSRSFSDEQRLAIYRRNEGRCQVCGIVCEDSAFHADHVVPHSRGGRTTVENGQVLCPEHNLSKGDRD
jgi:hypothetical protein